MTDLPGAHAAIPHTPGAHHVPKWAWIAGGAGIIGGVMLFHHRQAQTAAADAAAMNDPGTAGDNAGTVSSAVADPLTGDPSAANIGNGTTWALPTGGAPIVIGDPLPVDTTENPPDTPGTAQLPPISFPIQVGPINNTDTQQPVTGGGKASGTGPRNPKPPPTGHGASNIKDLHGGKASIAGKGPIKGGVKPHKQPVKGGPAKPPQAPPAPANPLYRLGEPSQATQAPVMVAPSLPVTPAPVAPVKAAGATAMPITGGGLPGTHAPPMTATPIPSMPAPAPTPAKTPEPVAMVAPPAPPHPTQAAMSQARVATATKREKAVTKTTVKSRKK